MEVPHDPPLRDVANARENNDHMMSAPSTVEMFGEKSTLKPVPVVFFKIMTQ